MKFKITAEEGNARTGLLELNKGKIQTPAFMPVGTYGAVKSVTPEEVIEASSEIILGNTFHLMLRPGAKIIKKHGGLHEFIPCRYPILTVSGGFQVFSLKHSQ